MADEKILTASNTVDADEPLNLLGVQILDALSTEGKYKVEPLHRTIEQLRVIVTALMKGHLQEKNYKKMNSLFEIYGSTEFLEVVMNDKTYESEKKDLFENLSILLKEQMVELENKRARARPKKCQSYGCPYLSLAPEGKFLGSKYCAMHHLAIYGPRTSCVCTDYFVKEVETSKYLTSHLKANGEDIKAKFKDCLRGASPMDLFKFLRAVHTFNQLDRGLRARGETIYRKSCRKSPKKGIIQRHCAPPSTKRKPYAL